MQQVVVPQFIDAEDKIIGPVTVRQFIELLIGGLIIFIFYKIFDFSLFVVSGLLVFIITAIVAFLKINGQTFHYFALNFLQTLKNPKLKIWKRVLNDKALKAELKKPPEVFKPRLIKTKFAVSASHLSELALIVDTGGVYQGENGTQK